MSHRSTSGCPHAEPHSQVEFATDQPQEGSPATEFRLPPTRSFFRKFYNDRLRFPDGVEAEIWSFEDERSGRCLPAPLIRAREGDVVHVTLKPSKGAHTIHLHGIEPDPRNDGVGHTSFEVTGEYTYQFQPQPGRAGDPNLGAAGTYFYHCHVNTVLHVQMGMFGPMIIDPATGPGKAFFDDDVGYALHAETLLVPYAIDPRWHQFSHAAGLAGEDVGLNRFNPRHFYVLGGNLNGRSELGPGTVKTLGEILATAPGKTPGLLRANNATYFPTRLKLLDGLKAHVIAHDGRALRRTDGGSGAAATPVVAETDVLSFGAAERYDMRLIPPSTAKVGDALRAEVAWLHWITGAELFKRTVTVRIVGDP